jgi:hypothetical protein
LNRGTAGAFEKGGYDHKDLLARVLEHDRDVVASRPVAAGDQWIVGDRSGGDAAQQHDEPDQSPHHKAPFGDVLQGARLRSTVQRAFWRILTASAPLNTESRAIRS